MVINGAYFFQDCIIGYCLSMKLGVISWYGHWSMRLYSSVPQFCHHSSLTYYLGKSNMKHLVSGKTVRNFEPKCETKSISKMFSHLLISQKISHLAVPNVCTRCIWIFEMHAQEMIIFLPYLNNLKVTAFCGTWHVEPLISILMCPLIAHLRN